MATGKKAFILYADQQGIFEKLPNEKAGELIKHILAYINDENPKTDDLIIQIAFEPIMQQLKRDLQKYNNICDRNKVNGSKGGRPKNPEKPTGLSGNPKKPQKPDTDNDTDNDIDKDTDKETIINKSVFPVLEIMKEDLDFQIEGKEEVVSNWFLELDQYIVENKILRTPPQVACTILNRVIGDNYWLTNLKSVEGVCDNWRAIMRVDEAIGEQKEATIEEMEEVVEETKENPFDIFWKLYPKKKGKGNAEKAWKKLGNPTEKIELIQQALVWQMESEDWIKDGGQYIPYPASYLNGKYWEDEESKPLERNWKKMTHDQAKKIMDGKDGKLQEDLMFNNPKLWNQLAQS